MAIYGTKHVAAVLQALAPPLLTRRQIERLTEQRAFIPSVSPAAGSGTRRNFSYLDLLALRAVALASDQGSVSLPRVRQIQQTLLDAEGRELSRLWLVGDLRVGDWQLVEHPPSWQLPALSAISLGWLDAELRSALRRLGLPVPGLPPAATARSVA